MKKLILFFAYTIFSYNHGAANQLKRLRPDEKETLKNAYIFLIDHEEKEPLKLGFAHLLDGIHFSDPGIADLRFRETDIEGMKSKFRKDIDSNTKSLKKNNIEGIIETLERQHHFDSSILAQQANEIWKYLKELETWKSTTFDFIQDGNKEKLIEAVPPLLNNIGENRIRNIMGSASPEHLRSYLSAQIYISSKRNLERSFNNLFEHLKREKLSQFIERPIVLKPIAPRQQDNGPDKPVQPKANAVEKPAAVPALAAVQPPAQIHPIPNIIQPKLDDSYFLFNANLLERKLENVFHAILHRCAEHKDKASLLKFISDELKGGFKAGQHLIHGEFNLAHQSIRRNHIWSAIKNSAAAALGFLCPPGIIKVLDRNNFFEDNDFHEAAGNPSLQAIIDAEQGILQHFPNWNPSIQCPEGIHKCPRLGTHGKTISIGFKTFISHIQAYEKKHNAPFISDKHEAKRLLNMLSETIHHVCELSIVSLAAAKGPITIDDKELKPCLRLMNNLLAIPTEFHDIRTNFEKNSAEIEKLLVPLDEDAKNDIFSFINTLIFRSEDPTYAHKRCDAGTHLIFSGPTASGKTFVAAELIRLLGLPFIPISLKDLLNQPNASSIDNLIENGRLSVLESKILSLSQGQTKGDVPLLLILFIDEVDTDLNLIVSVLKDRLDQFKKLHLPKLGITLPTFLNCIFTTNNKRLITDIALAGRVWQIIFPEMSIENKKRILLGHFQNIIHNNPVLEEKYNIKRLEKFVDKYTNFNSTLNLRVLQANLDVVTAHLLQKQRAQKGEGFFASPEARKRAQEPLHDFLQRIFKNFIKTAGDISATEEHQRRKPANVKTQKSHRPTCSSSIQNYDENSSDDGYAEDSSTDSDHGSSNY